MGKKNKTKPLGTAALFAYAGVEPEVVDCMLRDIRAYPTLRFISFSGDALIDRARSKVATLFLETDRKLIGDVLVMIDHDIVWQEGDLPRIIESAQATKGIVGAIYAKRRFGAGLAMHITTPGDYKIGEDIVAPTTKASTGFFAIHRSVLEKLAENLPYTVGSFYPFFMPALASMGDLTEELSEDWAFCARATEHGLPVHIDLKPRLAHIGRHAFRVIDNKMELPPDLPVTLNVIADPTHPVLSTLRRDVCEYAGMSLDSFTATLTDARRAQSALWYEHGGFDNELEWYKREDVGRTYIYDLAGWQIGTADMRLVLDTILAGGIYSNLRALDFGAGIGTMALALAANGCKVDTIEVNGELNDFAAYRAEKLGLSLNQVEEPSKPDYELIVCWHVLEHVSDPADLVAKLVSYLQPGGRVLTGSDFHSDDTHPMHHTDTNPDALWEGMGLVKESDFLWRLPPLQ